MDARRWFRNTMFERLCRACKGAGEFRTEFPDGTVGRRDCQRCEGIGTEPTVIGHQLLGMLSRHGRDARARREA